MVKADNDHRNNSFWSRPTNRYDFSPLRSPAKESRLALIKSSAVRSQWNQWGGCALISVSEPCADEVALRFSIGARRSDRDFPARFLTELVQAQPLSSDQFWNFRHCRLSGCGGRSVGDHRAPLGHRETPTAASGHRFVVLGNCSVVLEIAPATTFAKQGYLRTGTFRTPVVASAVLRKDHGARIARPAIRHNASAVLAMVPEGE
jgi:hypothetical protein